MEINLIVKVQQFEDKRIAAKASWNIKELKGKLSEIYPTSTEEQKLIYSGKLLNDTVVLKDVLREYEGQEAHTVHLVFTPKTAPPLSRAYKEQQQQQQKNSPVHSQTSTEMNTSELRQRHTTANATSSNDNRQATSNIPNNYYNAFYATNGMPDANMNILAQQYAMQTWMQQAYAQYINQYMNIMSSPEALQQQQQAQSMSNFAFMQPQMPFISPAATATAGVAVNPISSTSSTDAAAAAAPNQEVPQPAPQQPAVEAPQRRFPNIIQDEQENRDWLDILYSMSRLLILLCLVYFYSSPLRCCIVILIGVSIYLYHIYRQNQNRLNNNNTIRVNLNNVNNNRPAQQQQQPAGDVPAQDQQPAQNENSENSTREDQTTAETENLIATQNNEPQVPVLDIVKTFLVSFVASIIPSDPAI